MPKIAKVNFNKSLFPKSAGHIYYFPNQVIHSEVANIFREIHFSTKLQKNTPVSMLNFVKNVPSKALLLSLNYDF